MKFALGVQSLFFFFFSSYFAQGLTALMCATFSGHVKVVKELLLAKADPGLRRKVSQFQLCAHLSDCVCVANPSLFNVRHSHACILLASGIII